MHFQKQSNDQIERQYSSTQPYQNIFPRQNRNNIRYNYHSRINSERVPEMNNIEENQVEISNEGTYQNNAYQPHNIIRTIKENMNENYDPSQLVGNQNLSYAIHNYQPGFNEERTPSPKTINVGDTRENNVYNIRALNPRKSPNINNQFYQNQENRYIEPNAYEVRNGSFDARRFYREYDPFNDRDPNMMYGRGNDNINSPNLIGTNGLFLGNLYNGPNSGGRISLAEQQSYLQNYDEVNSSNDNIRTGSEDRRNKTYYGNMNNEIRTDFIENMNTVPNQPMNMNNYNNYNNNMSMMNNNTNMNMTHYYPQSNTILPQDEIQEKYENRTYDNMVYRDVKRIVRRFTKVYDPSKNNNGLLVHECQITVPGADDEIFNNRYRVLAKMGRLSSILLSKQRRSSPPKNEDDFLYNSDEMSSGDEPNIRPIKKYRRKTFNRQSFEKRARSPLVLPNRKSPENKFKYVSLAMISSKGLKTENRTILRKMRFEKGGVVDLAAEDRRKGKYQIRKVSRSPGYKHNFFKTNPRYRIKAAKYIQDWWKKLKENNSNKIKKIIKIQSVYRGRFVRKYLYDLLYLNYLYLSFCQKIEKVLKQKIKPYVFGILKNYGKKETDELLFDLLRNIVASKAKKWKIINKKRCVDKWKKVIRDKEKLILLIYKMMRKKEEKKSKYSILKEALRKWKYVVNTLRSKEEFEKEKELIIKRSKEHINKIKGLLKIVDGVSKYTKKSALEPTLPKLIQYLSKEYLNTLLRRIIQRKELDKKEILRKYFFKYIKMTLKYIKSHINENVKDSEMETEEDMKKEEFNMKRRIFLHLARSVKNKQNKNILGKYFKIF